MTPLPMSAGLSIPVTHTFLFPKNIGLGVIIGGGVGRHEGPYIIVEKVLDGMDAAKVRYKISCIIQQNGITVWCRILSHSDA